AKIVQTIFIAISASIYFQDFYWLRSYLLKANLATVVFLHTRLCPFLTTTMVGKEQRRGMITI
ncbi:hypothetical protein, partial [uncultured Bacteroides sp.]|uniref:hypothetical protein n=1 Tax=uncultured Bacteroides sp. TaxID=162156 RepID=UPI0026060056